MPDQRRRRCRRCGKTDDEVGPISWNGLCQADAIAAVAENVIGLVEHRGPALERWRRGMVACAGGVLLDDLTERT
jgi:hypothetical protein